MYSGRVCRMSIELRGRVLVECGTCIRMGGMLLGSVILVGLSYS
jgi:hypothetical protein